MGKCKELQEYTKQSYNYKTLWLEASSLSFPIVLLRLVTDSSAFDCCRFQLVDLALAGTTGSAAVRLAARWSQALMVGGGEGGMVVVRKQELISKYKFIKHGSRVRI